MTVEKSQSVPKKLNIFEVIWFYTPLAIVSEIMVMTQPLVQMSLARGSNPIEAIAAFSVAISLHTVTICVLWAIPAVGIHFTSSPRSVVQMVKFNYLISLLPFTVGLLIGGTSLGNFFFGSILGVSPAIQIDAKQTSLVMTLVCFLAPLRNTFQGMLMRIKKPRFILISSIIRLITLVIALWLLPNDRAVYGAFAMVICIWVESIVTILYSYAYWCKLPVDNAVLALRKVWTFSWPVMGQKVIDLGSTFAINVFIGITLLPDFGQAAFGIIYALTTLILISLRNITQCVQTFMRKPDNSLFIFWFSVLVICFLITISIVLFHTPLRILILGEIMNLDNNMIAYLEPGLKLVPILVITWGASAFMSGICMNINQTGILFKTKLAHLLTTIAIGLICVAYPQINVATVGMWIMIVSFLVEALLMARMLKRIQS